MPSINAGVGGDAGGVGGGGGRVGGKGGGDANGAHRQKRRKVEP
jgi:hypothetical protein